VSSAAIDGARASAPDTYVVLDDDDRIVHVSPRLHDSIGHWLGHVLWDHLPEAREVYGPHFEEARRAQEPVEAVVFYAGRVKRLTVIPAADGLAVHVEHLEALDVTSLGTLMRSLERIERVLAAPACAQRDPRPHASLRALP
jgi:hypothetical protein